MSNSNFVKTTFLDTNALVHLFLFWDACQVADCALDTVTSWQQLRTDNVSRRGDFKDVILGMQCFQNLHDAKEQFQYFTCQVCRSEMHRVILDHSAMETLISHMVPFSARRKRPLIIFRRGLESTDYDSIEGKLRSFFDQLRVDYAVDIKTLEDGHGADVSSELILSTAQTLWSHVLMETMDSYIFAASIQCVSDVILTSDLAFREMVNGLYHGSNEWSNVASELKSKLVDHLPSDVSVKFPQGFSTHQAFVNA